MDIFYSTLKLATTFNSKILKRDNKTIIVPTKNDEMSASGIMSALNKISPNDKKLILKILNNQQFVENEDPWSYKSIIFHDTYLYNNINCRNWKKHEK